MITVNQLSYTFDGATAPAVNQVSFAVAQGEIFGFLGPSGAGKSTTQRILIKLLTGYSGQVTINGRNLQDWGRDFYQDIGVCFESPNHYGKLTCAENLRYFARLYTGSKRPAAELLALVGLEGEADTPASALSKGMKIRLNLARALLNRPHLLFLDEPTAGLDPTNVRRVKDLVRSEANSGTTVFLTTHDMKLAHDLCDRVAFIVKGHLSEIDSPRSLCRKHGRREVRVELESGKQLSFPLDGIAEQPAFTDALRNQVRSIHTQEATLEDVFVLVTGSSLT